MMTDALWDWPEALAILTQWDCPSDYKAYYFVDVFEGCIRIILENEFGKSVSFVLPQTRPLVGLHAALDAILVQMRAQGDYYSFSSVLKAKLFWAHKRFTRRLDAYATRK